jgi:hypothetical protein
LLQHRRQCVSIRTFVRVKHVSICTCVLVKHGSICTCVLVNVLLRELLLPTCAPSASAHLYARARVQQVTFGCTWNEGADVWPPQRACAGADALPERRGCRCSRSSSGVSLCTVVLVKQVKSACVCAGCAARTSCLPLRAQRQCLCFCCTSKASKLSTDASAARELARRVPAAARAARSSCSIRQHTSAYVSIRQRRACRCARSSLFVQHTSAYVSIRQHTSKSCLPLRAQLALRAPVFVLFCASKASKPRTCSRSSCTTAAVYLRC